MVESITKTTKTNVPGYKADFLQEVLIERSGVGLTRSITSLTPMGRITASDLWIEWDPAAVDGSEDIRGFMVVEGIAGIGDAEDPASNVIMAGEIPFKDIPILAAYSEAQLLAQLKGDGQTPSVREQGLFINGMVGFF